MPYFFTCPKCQKPNYGFQSAPLGKPGGGIQYFDSESCIHCGAKGLYWVAEQAHVQLLTEQLNVPVRQIAVGVGTSNIAWFDPMGQKDVRPEVVDVLRGVATLDASFSQGTRREKLLPGRTDVKQGLCEGLSLHWIRRVLQGGSTTYQVEDDKAGKLRDDAERLKHLKRQVETGANVHRGVQPEARGKLRDQALLKAGFTRTKVKDEKTGEMKDGWNIPSGKRDLWDKLKVEYPAETWDELTTDLDKKALDVEGRKSKRPFSNVAVVCSVSQSAQPLTGFAATLCSSPRLQPGRAALISVGLAKGTGEGGGSISGHAIAAYCRANNDCYLFDPNIGNFRCTSPDNLRQAIVRLITAWETKMKWQLSGEFGYSLFERRASLESLKAPEIPVVTTPSPVATAQQNPLAIPRPVDAPAKVPTPAPLVAAAGRPGGVSARPTATPGGGSGAPKATPPVATSAAVKPAVAKPTTPATGGQQFRPQDPPKTIASTPTGSAGMKSRIAQWEQRAQSDKQ